MLNSLSAVSICHLYSVASCTVCFGCCSTYPFLNGWVLFHSKFFVYGTDDGSTHETEHTHTYTKEKPLFTGTISRCKTDEQCLRQSLNFSGSPRPPSPLTPPCSPSEPVQLDFPEFGRNLEEFMSKEGNPVKRVVMSREGLSHIEAQVPGDDYPKVNPHLISEGGEEGEGLVLPKGFDGTSLLPGAHVGGASYLPGVPPPPPTTTNLGGVEGADEEGIAGSGLDV